MESPRVVDDTDYRSQPTRVYASTGPRLLVVVKATFALRDRDSELEVLTKARRRPIRFADEPWGEPSTSAVRYPFDVSPDKPGTDVVFVGSAHSPGERAREVIDASVSAGLLASSVRAVGERFFGAGGDSLTDPAPTVSVPIRWDHAWGGFEANLDGKVAEEQRNPIGRGVCLSPEKLVGLPAPSIELPGEPIREANGAYTPAGLGVVARNASPRRSRAGTFDAAWHRERAPLPPIDQDRLFPSFAAPGLFSEKPFSGVETITLQNLTRGGGEVSFALPRVNLDVSFRGHNVEELQVRPHLDTILIDNTDEQELVVIELVYRASIAAPRRLGDVEIIIEEELV